MFTEITKIEYPEVTVKKDGEERVYEVEEQVEKHFIKLGPAEINFNDRTQKISFLRMEQDEEPDKKTQLSKLGKDVVNIKGKDFMTYEGLLKKAHDKGEFSMVITDSWVSEDMKMAWCKIRLTAGNQTFDGIGSSTPENTGEMTQTHPVEMSHTRSKARALRDYLNIGKVIAEEMKQ